MNNEADKNSLNKSDIENDEVKNESVNQESESANTKDEEGSPEMSLEESGEEVMDDLPVSEPEKVETAESGDKGNTESDDDDDDNSTNEEIDDVDHESLSKEQLAIRYKHLLETIPLTSKNLKQELDRIKEVFDDKHEHEKSLTYDKFIADGGEDKDFKMPPDPQVEVMNEIQAQYRSKRYALYKKLEEEKELNLLAKRDVIKGIKDLIQSEESLNNTFNSFKDLQNRWREIGPVPKANVKNLYENYHHSVEMFYDYIKINKELRDLDLRKNLEAKVHLCEAAEKLIDEENAVSAFNNLQEFHKEWREIGPVPKEDKEPIWERFKEATLKINKKHQEHYEELKGVQKENLDKKAALCEKVEQLAALDIDKPKTWNKKSDEIIAIQQEWRTIGFAPRKDNNKIYERFRKACDAFFDKKREFYQNYKQQQDENLELKKELAERAEALKDSEDWKKATNEFVRIQKEWKKIGPVPRKHSDAIWKKFRGACDYFFKRKKEFFKDIDKVQDENLTKKKQIIEEIQALEPGENNEETLEKLQSFKQQWLEIGHVPFKYKDAVYNEYRNAINKHFDHLNMEESKREIEKFRSKVEDIQMGHYSNDKINSERTKLLNKLRSLENDISVWENNIGFLSTSNKSSTVVDEYEKKIEKAKEHLEVLKKKVDLLNEMDE